MLPEELKDRFEPIAIELKKGKSSFHHARTVHGSGANDTPRPRRATVINVSCDGVMSNSNEPMLGRSCNFSRTQDWRTVLSAVVRSRIGADRQPVHKRESQTHKSRFPSLKTESTTRVGALQDQQLVP